MQQLSLPPNVTASDDAMEFLRAWVEGDDFAFVTLGNIFEDAGYIGIFLADLLRHIIATDEQSEAQHAAQISRAVAAFNAEFSQ